MEKTLIQEENFDNGVILRLYDASRKIAGDRWLVALAASAIVPIRQAVLRDVSADDFIKIRQALGDQVVFEQKRERYFIDEGQKKDVFDQLLENFRVVARDYVGHPRFPERFVAKSFREYQTRKQLNDQMINRK